MYGIRDTSAEATKILDAFIYLRMDLFEVFSNSREYLADGDSRVMEKIMKDFVRCGAKRM